jgi:ABC-type branched-subunit amino acid transport system permease subunit
MAETTAEILGAASAAVTGSATPDNVTMTRPTKESVWTLYGGMIISGALGALVIGILAWNHWIDAVAPARVMWLGVMGCMAVVGTPITVIALASSRLGQVKASAGDKSIEIDGRT